MGNRHHAACAAFLLLASVVMSPTLASDGPVDVCPVNSAHKSLPFLKTIKPGALGGLLANGLSIDMTAVTEFAKTTLIPVIGANVFFFALALLLLFVFILWRLLRWCCVVCCCRGGCDLRRSKHEPGELLFGKRMKINKGFMYLFGLVAVAFAVYGLATVEKSVTDGAFNVLTVVSVYANSAFDKLDDLLDTISGTTEIIDQFQAIVTVDIDVDGMVNNLTAIGEFIRDYNPADLIASVDGLTARVQTDFPPALANFSIKLSTMQADVNTVWSAHLPEIQDAEALLHNALSPGSGMQQLVTNVYNAMTAIQGPDPSVTASTPDPDNSELSALTSALTAMTAAVATDWVTQLDDLMQALTEGVGPANPFSSLRTKAVAVRDIADDISRVRLTSLIDQLDNMELQYTQNAPKMSGLLDKLRFINDTILALPDAMDTAYTSLADAKSNMDSAMEGPPVPGGVANQLQTFQGALPVLTDLSTLITALQTQEDNFLGTTSAPGPFPPSSTATYLAWVAVTRAAVAAMRGSGWSVAGQPFHDFNQNVISYSGPGYHTAVGTAHNTFYPLVAAAAGLTALGRTDMVPTVAAYTAAAAGLLGPAPTINLAGATSFVTASQTAMPAPSYGLPLDLVNVKSNLQGASAAYTALGSPPEQVVAQPKTQLQDIKTAAVSNGNSIKASIQSTVEQFQGSTGTMKQTLVNQVTDIKARFQEPAKTFDGYRYIASMALYGISILFVALVLAAAMANYHFGANLSTFLLMVITVLFFLLALIIALLIAALYMGCNEMEPLAIKLAPAQITSLLRYYFYEEGTSISAVLKDANLIDIEQVRGQVQDSKSDVLDGLNGQFTWRDNPANPRNPVQLIGQINNTIDTALGHVDALLNKADRKEMFRMYSEVKGYVCCSVPDMVAPMWTGLTMAGVFAVALIMCTFFYISKIDHAPRKDCCGCTCHTRSKYAGAVHPDGEALPQFATPGWQHTPGYEAPNGAMAMHVPWIAGSEHGMVNVVVAGPGGVPKAKAG